MELGVHLPLIPFSGEPPSMAALRAYATTASELGFRWLTANDHVVFRRPWLDGLTALAAVVEASGDMGLATTICQAAVRGPAQTAKAFAALDLLSGGRFAGGVGPGSSERDYELGGVPTDRRFARFEEAVRALRAHLGRTPGGEVLEPPPGGPGRPPLWLAGWGSERGLRRAAELGDGWLGSAYNTTPEGFADSWATVRGHVAARGGDPERFANGVATAWTYVTEERSVQERMLADVLSPLLGRSVEALRELSLPIGPAEVCAERLRAFADAGAQRVLLWPLGDELDQLRLVAERVAPLIPWEAAETRGGIAAPSGSAPGGATPSG